MGGKSSSGTNIPPTPSALDNVNTAHELAKKNLVIPVTERGTVGYTTSIAEQRLLRDYVQSIDGIPELKRAGRGGSFQVSTEEDALRCKAAIEDMMNQKKIPSSVYAVITEQSGDQWSGRVILSSPIIAKEKQDFAEWMMSDPYADRRNR
jgi:hypothetical protein